MHYSSWKKVILLMFSTFYLTKYNLSLPNYVDFSVIILAIEVYEIIGCHCFM